MSAVGAANPGPRSGLVDTRARETPRVDVVVLTWNDDPRVLAAAVDSTLASRGVEVRVWIIDNGSERPVAVPRDPRVRVVRNDANRGVAPGRAQGVALGDAPLVCLLDSDARLESDCLSTLSSVFERTSNAALAAPVFVGQIPEASAGAAPGLLRKFARAVGVTSRYAAVHRADGESFWPVEFTIGACQLIRRSAFDEVGGLDETIFYGPEDVDFCLRLRYAGWSVLQVAGARCHHPPRRRHRRLLTRGGIAHAIAVVRHLRRHRDGQLHARMTTPISGSER